MRRTFIILLISLLMAPDLHAQLMYLSDSRSINIYGGIADMGGNPMGSYGQSNEPSSSFSDYNGQVTGGAGGATSTASQQSSLNPAVIFSDGSVFGSVSSGVYGNSFAANAQASSTFLVTFGVGQSLGFNLSEVRDIESVQGNIDLELSSMNHGNIVSWDGPPGSADSLNYSGILQPDVYTLKVQEDFSFNCFGNSTDAGSMNYSMNFSVPEPAALGPVIALTFAGLAALKRFKLKK